MRYIGNKESMVEEIDSFIESRVESEESLTLTHFAGQVQCQIG